MQVDYSKPFPAADHKAWEAEYQANIKSADNHEPFGSQLVTDIAEEFYDYSYPQDWIEELESMDVDERKLVMDELASRPDLWSESEVVHE